MHFNIQDIEQPTSTFASRFVLPLWNYIVPPLKPNDPLYVEYLDFSEGALSAFVSEYDPQAGDVLEIFRLRRRIKLIGIQLQVEKPAQILIRPVMNSRFYYDVCDASVRSDVTYLLNGGILDRSTDVAAHSIVIDDPDFVGLQLEGSPINLGKLALKATLVYSEDFSAYAPTNSVKRDG